MIRDINYYFHYKNKKIKSNFFVSKNPLPAKHNFFYKNIYKNLIFFYKKVKKKKIMQI